MAAQGLPPLPPSFPILNVELLVTDAVPVLQNPNVQQWGLFLDGVPAIVADSVVTFDFRKEMTISDYTVEQGGFESYNKVRTPFSGAVRYSSGGNVSDRHDLLASIDAAVDALTLYDLVTPEAVYIGVNAIRYDYRRTATGGLGLLQVDVSVEEVHDSGPSTFTSTATPSGANPVPGGNVQPQSPTAGQVTQIPLVQ